MVSKIGLDILTFRIQNNLSQRSLGVLVGVQQSQISRWENGETMPRIKTQKRLWKVLSSSYHIKNDNK